MNNIKIFENDIPSDIDLSSEKVIGLDCEALGLVVGRDPLTLVQLGLKSKEFFLIKLNRETYKAPNLIKVLSNSSIQFIMHYARQDLLWLKYHLNVQPKNIFCTKIASKLARTYCSRQRCGRGCAVGHARGHDGAGAGERCRGERGDAAHSGRQA